MPRHTDSLIAGILARWVDLVRQRARGVILVVVALTLGLGGYTLLNLGINSDNVSLVPTDLPSRKAHEAFVEKFPNLEEAIFVVVDAQTPELARDAATRLTAGLQNLPDVITEAYLPGGSEFF